MLVGLVALAACDKGPQPESPPAPRPPAPPDAIVIVEVPADAAPLLDAAPSTPGIVELKPAAMQGPFTSEAKLCQALTCPAQGSFGDGTSYPIERVCPDVPDATDTGTRMPDPPAPFSEVFLKSMQCQEVRGRGGGSNYRVAVHRADGYWISAPMFHVGGNDKYCGGDLSAKWEARDLDGAGGKEVVVRVKGNTNCLACGKQGYNEDGNDLLIAIADGPTPLAFRPIVYGQHYHQKPADWAQNPEKDCPTVDRDVVLTSSWSPAGLSLKGAPTWKRLFGDGPATGVSMGSFEVDPPVPSSAGTYHFAIP